MVWFIYSLLTAFAVSITDALCKELLTRVDEYFVIWGKFAFAFPFLASLFLFTSMAKPSPSFWYLTPVWVPLEILALILYIKAIKFSPLSLTIPFLAFTPLFLVFTGFFMLKEVLSIQGLIGILFIVVGAYFLNFHTVITGLLAPFKAIVHEKGSWIMLIVAALFSINSTLGKMAIQYSSPEFYCFLLVVIMSVFTFPFVLWKTKGIGIQLWENKVILTWIGLTNALMFFFHTKAIILTNVAYMISIKRLSLLFSVYFGYYFFHEKNIRERALGSCIMLVGVVVISLS